MNYKNNLQKNGAGFTLIELLLSVFIFALLVLAISGVYLAFSKSQSRTKASQQLLNDTQYALEVMAREIRNDSLFDYEPTQADCNAILGTAYDDCILLERADGQLVAFALNNIYYKLTYILPDCNDDYSICNLPSYKNTTDLLSTDINSARVLDLAFYIEPSSDPYVSAINQQPKVTIRLKVEYNSLRVPEQVTHLLQTTISSRIYKR